MNWNEKLINFIKKELVDKIKEKITLGYIHNEMDFQCYIFYELEKFITFNNLNGAFHIFNTPSFNGIKPDIMIFNQNKLVIIIELKYYFKKNKNEKLSKQEKKRLKKDISKLNLFLNKKDDECHIFPIFISIANHKTINKIEIEDILHEKIKSSIEYIIINEKKTPIWIKKNHYLK